MGAQPILAGVLLAALIVCGAALWIEGRLMRPLRRLGRAVHRAAEGDLVVRAAAPAGNGEVARLAASFNRLLARITALQADEVDVQRDLADAHEQLKLQQAFEEANALLERRLNELSLLYEVARSFTSTLELPELLARISTHVAERLSIPQFSIMLLNPDGSLEVKTAYPPGQGTERIRFHSDEGACGRAAQTHTAVYIADVESDTAIFVARPGAAREIGSLLCVPMIHHEEVLGVLNFQDMEIARANRFGNQVSIVMLDIDHFKSFNDAAGHRAGDGVLRQVAALMKGMIRKVDILGRYGGEEFLLILPQVTKVEAMEVAEKLRRAVAGASLDVPRNPSRITISAGIANLPVDATSWERLVDCADAALYASKRAGRNQTTSYAQGMELHPGRERISPAKRALASSGN